MIVGEPDLVRIQRQPDGPWQQPDRSGVEVTTAASEAGCTIAVAADGAGEISRLHLRWHRVLEPGVRVLGDAWERGYGDLQWPGLHPNRLLPWTALVHSPRSGATWGVGVEVRPAAFAAWTVDAAGFSLWLDLRAGSEAGRTPSTCPPPCAWPWTVGSPAASSPSTGWTPPARRPGVRAARRSATPGSTPPAPTRTPARTRACSSTDARER